MYISTLHKKPMFCCNIVRQLAFKNGYITKLIKPILKGKILILSYYKLPPPQTPVLVLYLHECNI